MSTTDFIQEVITDDGYVAPKELARILHITQRELANIAGLRRDAVSKRARVRSLATQKRLRETLEILNRVSAWCGGPGRALAWFRSQPLPSFGDQTAEDLLKAGRGDALRAYLTRVSQGGYA